MVMIIGSEGSMGKRYQAILKYLGESFFAIDLHNAKEIEDQLLFCDEIIICTPTDTHLKYLKMLIPTGKKILCEKPITKSISELEIITEMCEFYKNPITMVMQYLMLVEQLDFGYTFYDYFRTGNDGLFWDCLQIIGLAKGEYFIKNDSPIWQCSINGRKLSIKDMDQAYVDFIDQWLRNKLVTHTMDTYLEIHKKVDNAERRFKEKHQNIDSDTSA